MLESSLKVKSALFSTIPLKFCLKFSTRSCYSSVKIFQITGLFYKQSFLDGPVGGALGTISWVIVVAIQLLYFDQSSYPVICHLLLSNRMKVVWQSSILLEVKKILFQSHVTSCINFIFQTSYY